MENLTRKIKEIRKFARFGLIVFTKHANERIEERHLNRQDVIKMLMDGNNSIAQYQEHYKGAEYSAYVVWAQHPHNKNYYHIVVYDEVSDRGGHLFKISTVYKPSDDLFTHHGRYLKKKYQRSHNIIR